MKQEFDFMLAKSFDVELFSITATYIHEQWLKITQKVSFYVGLERVPENPTRPEQEILALGETRLHAPETQ